jgi:carboxypeptidase C (cathepsin A)
MIFLDQPIGVGFSYADHGETVVSLAGMPSLLSSQPRAQSRTEESAVDVAAFFAILSEQFPQFRGRKLHLAGESFGGRFLPLSAAAIMDQNAHLERWGMHPINLASVVIGNGLSDFYSYAPLATIVAGAHALV